MRSAALFKIDPISEQEIFLSRLDGKISVGKSSNADVQLNDWRCNGIHALIKNDEKAGLTIIDLGSYFGTFVNQQKVANAPVKIGDRLKIGDQNLVIRKATKEILATPEPEKKPFHKPPLGIQAEKTILEVSLFWGDQLLEVKNFTPGNKITIGNKKDASFGLSLAKITNSKTEDAFDLGHYEKGELKLVVPSESQGLIWQGQKTIALDTLRIYSKQYAGKPLLDITLRLGDKAHLEFGELSIYIRFIRPPEKIKKPFKFNLDKNLLKILAAIVGLYLFTFLLLSILEVEEKEKDIEDIPDRLKKIVYDVGIENAEKKRRAAIGQIAKTLEGGRAKAEEGKSKAKKAKKAQPKKAPPTKTAEQKPATKKAKLTTKVDKAPGPHKAVKVDLDKAFETKSSSSTTPSAILAKVDDSGNTASALMDGGFARGKSGLGPGGGGESVGIGAVKGNMTGGGMGSGDYGLSPSKGRQIQIEENEVVVLREGLDPELINSYIKRYMPQIRHCYELGLNKRPNLAGKVAVKFVINPQGGVDSPKIAENDLHDATTEKCILEKVANWTFPKPKGGSSVGVKYPFILESNIGN